jgi:hypothetical protein
MKKEGKRTCYSASKNVGVIALSPALRAAKAAVLHYYLPRLYLQLVMIKKPPSHELINKPD